MDEEIKKPYDEMELGELLESQPTDPVLFCQDAPKPSKPLGKYMEKFLNWARANSLWILGFGTGCGAVELRPLMTARFDMYRYGIAGRPTPRQSSVFIIGGYASVKTLKRIIRSYEQMQGPKFVIGLGSCTINGGMYWDSYNTINRIDAYIPVDVYITGCIAASGSADSRIQQAQGVDQGRQGGGREQVRREFRVVQSESEEDHKRLEHARLQLVRDYEKID